MDSTKGKQCRRSPKRSNHVCIVWASNAQHAFQEIIALSKDFPVISVISKYPGAIIELVDSFYNIVDIVYKQMREIICKNKPLYIEITLFDKKGKLPSRKMSTWRFKLKFDIDKEALPAKICEALKAAGIDFNSYLNNGIDYGVFLELMLSSGLLFREDITFLSFQGYFLFGFLVKMLTKSPLPTTREEFFKQVKHFFPFMYDAKCIMESQKFYGGLKDLARQLEVKIREPKSVLSGLLFKKIKQVYFPDGDINEIYNGVFWGLQEESYSGSQPRYVSNTWTYDQSNWFTISRDYYNPDLTDFASMKRVCFPQISDPVAGLQHGNVASGGTGSLSAAASSSSTYMEQPTTRSCGTGLLSAAASSSSTYMAQPITRSCGTGSLSAAVSSSSTYMEQPITRSCGTGSLSVAASSSSTYMEQPITRSCGTGSLSAAASSSSTYMEQPITRSFLNPHPVEPQHNFPDFNIWNQRQSNLREEQSQTESAGTENPEASETVTEDFNRKIWHT